MCITLCISACICVCVGCKSSSNWEGNGTQWIPSFAQSHFLTVALRRNRRAICRQRRVPGWAHTHGCSFIIRFNFIKINCYIIAPALYAGTTTADDGKASCAGRTGVALAWNLERWSTTTFYASLSRSCQRAKMAQFLPGSGACLPVGPTKGSSSLCYQPTINVCVRA